MASAVKQMTVDNDSVIYEHIIPRSVRQKWMRRASFDHLDLITTSPKRERKILQTSNATSDALARPSYGDDYGDSIVSHDVQNEDGGDSGGLITPEEEKAVFNAFGVRLRHIGISLPASKKTENLPEVKDSKIVQRECQKRQRAGKEFDSKEKGTDPKTSVKLRDGQRKVRPLSMPAMTEEVEKSYKILVDKSGISKTKHKAYISPHAKVPWKRNLAANADESNQNSQIKAGRNHNEDSIKNSLSGEKEDKNIHVEKTESLPQKQERSAQNDTEMAETGKTKSHRNQSEFDSERNSDKMLIVNEEKANVMQSVSERLKSFELQNIPGKNKNINVSSADKSRSMENSFNSKIIRNGVAKKSNDIEIGRKDNVESNRMIVKETNTNKNIAARIKVKRDEVADQKVQKGGQSQNDFMREEKRLIKENNHNKLLEIIQSTPVQRSEANPDVKGKLINDKLLEKSTNSSIENNAEIDKSLVLSARKNFEKKINKMVILTGEQREREIKSEPGQVEKKGKLASNEIPPEQKLVSNKSKELNQEAMDVPVTNLDDTYPMQDKDESIPVTNIDEIQSPTKPSQLVQSKSESKEIVTRNFRISSKKKPGKYDADRRALVAPKVVFEEPVTGLVSALSPKGKKTEKVWNVFPFH